MLRSRMKRISRDGLCNNINSISITYCGVSKKYHREQIVIQEFVTAPSLRPVLSIASICELESMDNNHCAIYFGIAKLKLTTDREREIIFQYNNPSCLAGVLPKIIRTNGVGMLDDIPRTVFLCLYGKGTLCVNIDTSLIVSAFERWHVSFLARRDVIGNTTAICVRDVDTCEGDTGTEKEFLLVLDSTPNTKKLRTSRIEILLFRYDLDFVWACVISAAPASKLEAALVAVWWSRCCW